MYTDERTQLKSDITKTMYMQLILQIAVADVMSAKKDYAHFRLVNALFIDSVEKVIDKNIKNETTALNYKELLEANSTFALFINDCAAANYMYDKLDLLASKYKELSFDFGGLTEDQRTKLLLIDRWQDSEVFLKLYDKYGSVLAGMLTSTTPKFDFNKNLENAEKFIEDVTKVNITSDKNEIEAVKSVFNVKTDADIENILVGGIISPRDVRSDGEQAEIFIYNRIAAISIYRDLLKDQMELMDNKWGIKDLGTTHTMLSMANEIVNVYEKFYDEPMTADAYYFETKDVYLSAVQSWCSIQENYGTNETYDLVMDLYSKKCDEFFDINYEVMSALDYNHCMA